MSEMLVKTLLSRPENHIHICDYSLEQAERIASNYPSRATGHQLNASDKEEVRQMVKLSTSICVSLLPGMFHDTVASCCLEEKKHMTNASYLTEGIKSMADSFKDNNLTMIGECGLDPGLDHIMAMRLIHECEENG
jgi:saccharopine dehydrogenase-like NADP-dependent oxidoreductase